jgi:protein gp37
MGEHTAIAWTDHTWNPWIGCKKVSAGCKYCYMFREMKRYGKNPNIVARTSPSTWKGPLRWEPGRVFTCSWSDFFISDADPWRAEAWEVIKTANWHEWIILTKRPKAAWNRFPPRFPKEFPQVRLSVTVEAQENIDRIDDLLYVPGVQNMISVEPILSEVDLTPFLSKNVLDWIVVGGETDDFGNARKLDVQWIYKIIADCKQFNVPVFVKQMGTQWATEHEGRDDPSVWPEGLRIQQFPKFIGVENGREIYRSRTKKS